jgi:hypothetical protein
LLHPLWRHQGDFAGDAMHVSSYFSFVISTAVTASPM